MLPDQKADPPLGTQSPELPLVTETSAAATPKAHEAGTGRTLQPRDKRDLWGELIEGSYRPDW